MRNRTVFKSPLRRSANVNVAGTLASAIAALASYYRESCDAHARRDESAVETWPRKRAVRASVRIFPVLRNSMTFRPLAALFAVHKPASKWKNVPWNPFEHFPTRQTILEGARHMRATTHDPANFLQGIHRESRPHRRETAPRGKLNRYGYCYR